MQHDIFICYSRHDLAAVKPIQKQFKLFGFSCWMNLSKSFCEVMDRSLVVLFFLSQASQISELSQKMLQYSKEKGKKVIVVRFSDDSVEDTFASFINGLIVFDWRIAAQRHRLLSALMKIKSETELRKKRRTLTRKATSRKNENTGVRKTAAKKASPAKRSPAKMAAPAKRVGPTKNMVFWKRAPAKKAAPA